MRTSTNVFVDNCFIHAGDNCITLKITPRDRTTTRNVFLEDIYIEQTQGHFLEARIMEPRRREQTYHPAIDSIFLTNIYLLNEGASAYIHGLSQEHKVRNVHFKSLNIGGKRILEVDTENFFLNDFVEGITVE